MASPLTLAYIYLVAAQVALGFGGTFARFAMAEMDPVLAGAVRFGLVGVAFTVVRRPSFSRRDELLLGAAGLLFVQQYVCWSSAIRYLPLGMASLLCATAPLWSGLFETFALKKALPKSFWGALAIAAVGTFTLIRNPGMALGAQAQYGIGILYGVGAGMGIASTMLFMKGMRHRGCSSVDLMGRSTLYTGCALLALAMLRGHPIPPLSHWQTWGGAAGMAVVCQGFGCCLQLVALKHVRASVVGCSALAGPVFATTYGALLFHEQITASMALGGALIILAVAWALLTAPADATTVAESRQSS